MKGVEHDRLGAADPEAVLEERAPRDVVLEQLRETSFPRAHRLVDRLRFLLGRLADEHLAGLLGAPERLVLGLGPPREGVDEVRR